MGSHRNFSSLFLFALVIIMGCTGDANEDSSAVTTSSGTYGLVLEELRSDVGIIEEGDVVTLTMTVTNVDNQVAKNIKAKIYPVGLSPVGASEFGISSIEQNSSDFFEFDMKAPTLNVDRTFTPYSLLCYTYRSTATTTNFVVDNNIYDLDNVPTLSQTSSTGPVTMSLGFSSNVLKILTNDDRQKTLSVALTNADSGYVINSTDSVLPGLDVVKDIVQKRGLLLKIPATASVKLTIDNSDSSNSFDCAIGTSLQDIGLIESGIINNYGVTSTTTYSCTAPEVLNIQTCIGMNEVKADEGFVCQETINSYDYSTYNGNYNDTHCCVLETGTDCSVADEINTTLKISTLASSTTTVTEDTSSFSDIVCTNNEQISFGSRGEGKTLRLPLVFDIKPGEQDVPFFIGEMDYRYCLQSEQLTIQAKKFN